MGRVWIWSSREARCRGGVEVLGWEEGVGGRLYGGGWRLERERENGDLFAIHVIINGNM